MSDPTRSLEQALAEAEAALLAGDPATAAAAVGAGVEACQRLSAEGRTPAGAELAALRACHARLLDRALAARDVVCRTLDQVGRSRRAATCYRGR